MSWPTIQISKICELNPRNFELKQYPDDFEVSFVPMQSVSEVTGAIEERITRKIFEVKKGFTFFKENDVLFAKITPCMENGKIAIAKNLSNGIGYGSTEFHILRPNKLLDHTYLYYFLRQDSFRNEARIRMSGAVGQQRVPISFLQTYSIPFPSPSEQRRIVEILAHADEIRKLRKQADEKAEKIIPALFYEMFGDPTINGKSYGRKFIDDVVLETQYGISSPSSTDGKGIPILRMNNITYEGEIDLTDLKYIQLSHKELDKFKLNVGDILFNRTNSKELVGKTGIWLENIEAVPASYLIKVKVNTEFILPEYLWAFMNSTFVKQHLLNLSRRAIGMANINAKELRSIPILVPEMDQQQVFRNNLEKIFVIKPSISNCQKRIQNLFDTLLSKAFDGSLTASWRETHMKELLKEMEEQKKYLENVN